MNGGANQDMGIGAIAWKSIHFVKMVCTTRYGKLQTMTWLYNSTNSKLNRDVMFFSFDTF